MCHLQTGWRRPIFNSRRKGVFNHQPGQHHKEGQHSHSTWGKRHKDCRRIYCSPHQIAKDTRKEESKTSTSSDTHVLRSSEEPFSFKTHCLFCGSSAKFGKKRKTPDVLHVKTIELKDTLLAICCERADVWSDAVKARILHVHDLHAADAVYHHTCSLTFALRNRYQ